MPLKKLLIFLIVILALVFALASCTTADSDYVKISFFVDGRAHESFWVVKGGSLDEEPQVPDKEGMVGVWSITEFDDLQTNLRVDAIYSSANCTVTFQVDDQIVETITLKKNASLTQIPQVPEREGYEGNWNFNDFTNIAQDITVSAEYKLLEFIVSFMGAHGLHATRNASYGGSITNIPDLPSYPGKVLSARWKRQDDLPLSFNNIKSNLVIYAEYYTTIKLVNSYLPSSTLTFDLNEIVNEPIGVGNRSGYDFYGWYFDEELTQKVEFSQEFTFEENCDIYARWLKTSSADDFEIVDGTITSYTGLDADVVIPYKDADGKLVTSIGTNAFNESSIITSISIPGTITTIKNGAFSGLINLKTLKYPDQNNIKTIGDNAFENCVSLESFSAGKHLEAISNSAFINCSSLESVYLGNITSIGNYAFSGIKTISNIEIPASVNSIGISAFQNMTNTTFEFAENNVVYLGNGAFENCQKLTKFIAPKLQSIGNSVFAGCFALESATMMSNGYLYKLFGISSMAGSYEINDGSNIYYVPTSLVNVNINANLGREGVVPGVLVENALLDAYFVKNVTLLGNFTTIESNAFKLSEASNITQPVFTVTISSVGKIASYAFSGRKDLVKISLPATLVEIGDYAFYNLNKLYEVTIAPNNGLSKVGKYVFEGTKWLNDYVGIARLGKVAFGFGSSASSKTALGYDDFIGLTIIAPNAFFGNTRLTEVIIPKNIISIGNEAFSLCEALQKMKIPEECENLGIDILSGCFALTEIEIGLSAELHKLFGETIYENSYIVTKEKDYFIPNSLTKLTIKADSETEITKGKYNGYSSLTTIILGEDITKIYDEAFADCENLIAVTIPNTLVEIGTLQNVEDIHLGAFRNCPNLSTLNISTYSSLTTIYDKAFQNTKLQILLLPPMVTNIGAYAFANTNLSVISFASGVNDLSIGDFAFSSISTAAPYSLVMPSNLVSIGDNAFYNNNNLTGIKLNDNLENVGKFAFANCNLLSFTLPSYVKLYDENEACLVYGLLQNNKNLTSLTLSNGITVQDLFIANYPSNLTQVTINGGKIIDNQFRNLTSLQKVELIDVTHIGNNAFDGCSNNNLISITIPASVKEIGDNAFANCLGLTKFLIFSNSVLETVGKNVFAGDSRLEQVIFPSTVTNTSWSGIFNGCENLTATNIPHTVTEIGDNTFNDCYKLKTIYIPDNIETIGNSAFNNCYEMIFENSNFEKLTHIGENAFNSCDKLVSVKAENIAQIGENAFANCNNMKEITVLDLAPSDYISNVTNIATIDISKNTTQISSGAFANCTSLVMIFFATNDSMTLDQMLTVLKNDFEEGNLAPNVGVFILSDMYTALSSKLDTYKVRIYSYPTLFDIDAFDYDNENMTATLKTASSASGVVYIPRRVKFGNNEYVVAGIGNGAFKNNKNIISIIVPSTITYIGNEAFSNCTNLSEITFEAGSALKTIGDFAFEYCLGLVSITIPDNVITIGTGAFYECNNLRVVEVSNNSKIENISEYAFANTAWLNDYSGLAILGGIAIGYGTTYITNGNVTEIKFAELELATKIASYSFSGISTLSAIEISDTILSIENNAFSNNINLTNVIFNSYCELGANVFSGCVNLESVYILSEDDNLVSAMLDKLNQEDKISVFNDCVIYLKENVYLKLSQQIDLLELTINVVS